MPVGNAIFKQITKSTAPATKSRTARQITSNERQRWISYRARYCPYEINNRPTVHTGDPRYEDGYTCEDYMDEWVVTWNSYARFAGDMVKWQNKTTYDVLELYTLTNLTAGAVETLRKRSVDILKKLHVAEIIIGHNLNTLRYQTRLGFSIAEQRSTLSNALANTLITAQMDAAA